MDDEKKTRTQLIEELDELRKRVTELKGFEEEIKQTRVNQEKFAKAFLHNSIPVGITTLKEGRFVEISDAFLRLMGLERDGVIGYTSREIGFITEEQREIFFEELNKRGHIENLEMRVGIKDGAMRDGLFNAVIISFNNEDYLLTVMMDITDRKRMEEELINQHSILDALVKERTADLEIKTRMLEDINKALKVLLLQRDEEKRDLEDQFVANIKSFILPYIKKMKNDGLDSCLKSYLSIMEANLNELISPFLHSIRQHNFTPKEMIVASLIRDGKTTKEIAKIMEVGTSAIDSHRNRIRNKLGLKKRRNINLHSYLSVLK